MFALVSACGGGGDSVASSGPPPQIASILVSLSGAALAVGQTRTATAEARDQDGAVMTGVNFTWASSNSSVATVSDGVATGAAAGSAGITASSAGVTSNMATLTVIAVPKGSVAIDRTSVFFTGSGQSRQLTALALDPQGASVTGPVTWTSTAPDKVSVDSTGHVAALTIGSAQIVAESAGVKSAPTLVVVAEPQPGALLVTDAQVVSVGPPLGVAVGTPTGVGTQYEVTLEGVAAPLPGTVMLAAETAPIAGKVVSTRPVAGGVVVTMELAPLPQLFRAYDIDWTIDLSAFAAEPAPARSAQLALGAAWSQARYSKARPLAAVRPLDALSPFKPFDCEASIAPQIAEKKTTLSLDNKLSLVIQDKPGYSRHSLEGSATITGSASLKLNVGFNAKGSCDATAQVKFPVLGWFSVILMPAVRFGIGAAIDGEIRIVQGELAVDGDVGFTALMGWECGGATPECRSLDSSSAQNHLKTRSKIPSKEDMQALVSGQFYVLAGFDLSLFVGAANAKVVEARIGPKQSFDLAFEADQAVRADYASSYDLKLVAVVEPGSSLKKAIELAIGDDSVDLKFKAESATDLSESPKGTLSASKTRVAIGAPIDFSVDFDAKTVSYDLLGYNITGVQLYRRRDDEAVFTEWKAMTLIASNKATYRWTPETADAGNYEFAAFVNTQIQPLPWLEVAPNSIQKVEVSCFSAGALAANPGSRAQIQAAPVNGARSGPRALTCADTWVGTTTSGDAADGPNQTQASLTLKVDPRVTGLAPGQVFYYAEGTVKVKGHVTDLNGVHCEYLPLDIAVDINTGGPAHGAESNQFSVNFGASPPTAGGAGIVTGTQTVVCPGSTTTITRGFAFMSGPEVLLSPDGLSWSGSNLPFYSFQFTRP